MLEVNVGTSDTKELFEDYIAGTDCAFPAIYSADGGNNLSKALGNGSTGGPSYMISPDKTFKKSHESYIEKHADYTEHKCKTSILKEDLLDNISMPFKIDEVTDKSITLVSNVSGSFSLKIVTLKGTIVADYNRIELEQGKQELSIKQSTLSSGIYFIHLQSSAIKTSLKLIIK